MYYKIFKFQYVKRAIQKKCLLLLLFIMNILTPFSVIQAVEFDCMIVPSLMDSDMDGWYKIPPNRGPNIHKASSVVQGQMFNLLLFFKGYSADKNNNLHLRYDVQIYDSEGNPTNDKQSDILAYQGPMGHPESLILNQQYLQIIFTEKYQLGTYKIKVTAYDKIASKSFSLEIPLNLVPFTMPEKFESEKEVGNWLMGYYRNPKPTKAISGILKLVQVSPNWPNENMHILHFFRIIFSNNPFLFANIAKHFNSFSQEDQKKLLLISAISKDSILESTILAKGNHDVQTFYNNAKMIKVPNISGKIISADQLDMLWSEFLTTGKYQPIKKIVSALALKRYEGTLEKIKSGEIEEVTNKIEQQAYLEATYSSARWSLINNCQQMPLVFKYCVFIYDNENLNDDIKSQLGSILNEVQKELEEQKIADKN